MMAPSPFRSVDTDGEDVLAGVFGVAPAPGNRKVGTLARLFVVPDNVEVVARATRHVVGPGRRSHDLGAALLEEAKGAKLPRDFRGGFPYSSGVHNDLQVCVGRASGSGDYRGAVLFV